MLAILQWALSAPTAVLVIRKMMWKDPEKKGCTFTWVLNTVEYFNQNHIKLHVILLIQKLIQKSLGTIKKEI